MPEKDLHTPPQLLLRFFRWYCHPDYLEDIEGDLMERFEKNTDEKGIKAGKLRFLKDVLLLFRPGIIKPLMGNSQLNNYGMLRNNVKTAFRIFKLEKFFTTTNVVGLTAGIWCSILIMLWVQHEFSFDRFHTNGDQLYRLLRNDFLVNNQIKTKPWTAYPIADVMVEEIPGVVDRVRCAEPEPLVLSRENQFFKQIVTAADPNFFEVFSFPLMEGNPKSCLQDLSSIVISEELANNYFDTNSEVIGSTISIHEGSHSLDFKVTGIFRKIPDNSSMQFDAILPLENYLQLMTNPENWGFSWLFTYIVLDEQAKMEEVNNQLKDLPKRKVDADWFSLMLQPYADQYLYSKIESGQIVGGRINYVIIFSIISVFTLLIACFNFINLTTARSTRRSKEIGIRKVIGAGKGNLISQFLVESALLIMLSITLAVLLAQLSLPAFNEITGKNITIDYFNINFHLTLLAIAFVTLLFSGIYPAIFLASFQAILALKGKLKKNTTNAMLRRGLVTFQFGLVIMLVAGTLAVFLQLTYIQNKDLGLERENIIYVPMDFKSQPHYTSIKTEISRHSAIKAVSATDGDFMTELGTSSDPIWKNKGNSKKQLKRFAILDADFGLTELLGIHMDQGRPFSYDFPADTANFIINQEAAATMGMEYPVGEDLELWGVKGKIIGVAENFHFASLHDPIMPIIMRCKPSSSSLLYVKTQPGKTKEALGFLEKMHDKYSDVSFTYHFLDKTLEQGYKREIAAQKLAGYFSFIAIIISCLGLLGLASYAAEQRTKEMAIRKAMGAKIVHIINLLFSEYLKLILIGLLIGIPVAYYLTESWLNSFAYKVQLGWWVYALPGVLVLLIAFLTVGQLSFKTARANLVDFLKND